MTTDKLLVCLYCGATAKFLTPAQIKVFGKPVCCEYSMVEMDRNKIYTVVKALEVLKKNLEAEILEGME